LVLNVAVTFTFVVPIETLQFRLPVGVHPVHDWKAPVEVGEATSCTVVPELTMAVQTEPQLIPVAAETTLPVPMGPLRVTDRDTWTGPQVGLVPDQVPSAPQTRVVAPFNENPIPQE
jgi:hypothetical protein